MREYTDPSVFEGIKNGADWADPTPTPEGIDWTERLKHAAIPFAIIDGRPVKPGPSTGITRGRNELGHWGEMQCADALVFAIDPSTDQRRLLMIERGDGHGWAIPGGKLDTGETALAGGVRELDEETALSLPGALWTVARSARLVDDPRASDESWMVTTPVRAEIFVPADQLPPVDGRDDARRAAWVLADSYAVLQNDLAARFGGTVFRAHRQMLAEILNAR